MHGSQTKGSGVILPILQWLILTLILFCAESAQDISGDVRPVRSACPPLAADNYFFPDPSDPFFSLAVSLDSFFRQWYSEHLRAMSEPSLSCGKSGDREIYRFLWLRTFHHPIAVRIARSENGGQLSAIVLSGAGGYKPGSILKQVHKSLSPDQWEELIDEIKASEYWFQSSVEIGGLGCDGAQWIIEARRGQTYHVVDRWAGGENYFLGLLFLELAGLKSETPIY